MIWCVRVAVAALFVAQLLVAAPARADTWEITVACGTRDAVTAYLRDQVRATPVGFGTSINKQQLLETWVAPDGRFAWVVTVAGTQRSCILGSGVGWTPGAQGSPS